LEPPRRTGFGAAVSVKARSAEAETVVVTVAELLAGLGSVSVAVMEALLVMRPADVGLTMMVTVAVAALGSVPILHETAAVPEQAPWVEAAETKVGVPGRLSIMVTLVAGDGPLLVTVMV